jgi:hypothetical protein
MTYKIKKTQCFKKHAIALPFDLIGHRPLISLGRAIWTMALCLMDLFISYWLCLCYSLTAVMSNLTTSLAGNSCTAMHILAGLWSPMNSA